MAVNKKNITVESPDSENPTLFLDDKRLIARFTDAHTRALLLKAGAQLISTNRVCFDVRGLTVATAHTPLQLIKNRLYTLAKLNNFPKIWEDLFEETKLFKESIVETTEYVTFRLSNETDMLALRQALQSRERWTQYILLTDSEIIMVEENFSKIVQNGLLNHGILLGNL